MDIQMISIYPGSAWHVLAWEHIDWIFSFSILEHIIHTAYDTILFAASLMVCIMVYRGVSYRGRIVISYCGKISVPWHHYYWLILYLKWGQNFSYRSPSRTGHEIILFKFWGSACVSIKHRTIDFFWPKVLTMRIILRSHSEQNHQFIYFQSERNDSNTQFDTSNVL